jgi:hypothetical protein
MSSADLVTLRPRTSGEILDDAWRLYFGDAPQLLILNGLFLVPAFAALLLLLTQPVPETVGAQAILPLLAGLLLPLTGLGSGACQDLLRRRAAGDLAPLGACLAAALRRGFGHVAARGMVLLVVPVGLGYLLMPGLAIWMAATGVHVQLAAARTGSLRQLRHIGREARFAPGKAAAVTLSRVPLLVLAFINLHLLVLAGLWVAGHLANLDVALLNFQLSLANPVYCVALVLLCWLLLAPFFEAGNFLLSLDTRTRQEGLDLLYRVQRVFALADRKRAVLVLAVVGTFLFGPGLTAHSKSEIQHPKSETLEVVRQVRGAVQTIQQEVSNADPFPGGGRWVKRLEELGERLQNLAPGQPARYRWVPQALVRFAERSQAEAVDVLADLDRRLGLLEESLAGPDPADDAGGEGNRPRPSKDAIKQLLRPERDNDSDRRASPRAREDKKKTEDRKPADEDDKEAPVVLGRRGQGTPVTNPGSGLGETSWQLLTGLLLAVLLVGGLLFWFNGRVRRPPEKRAETGAATEEVQPQPHEQPPALLWQQADDLARGGRFLEALRSLYWAVLSLLHRQQLLRYETTRTNGEYVQQVRLAPQAPEELHPVFERLTALFELKWYGERACDAAEYGAGRQLAEDVRDLAGAR